MENSRVETERNARDDLFELLKRATNIASMGIHVVDLETMEMYYCNDAGFRLIRQEPRPYRGKPCYEVFFGSDHPCDNCRREQTRMGETRHEVYVPEVDKTFLTNTEITSLNGRQVFVEYITDITSANQALLRQEQLLARLELSSRELRKKYAVEKRRSSDDKSILAYAVFNLRTGQTVEMERRTPLVSLDARMTMAEFRDDIAGCILSDDAKRSFCEMFDPTLLVQHYHDGIDEQAFEFQRILPGGKVIWARASFHLMPDPDDGDLLLFYYCNDINLRKSLEIMTGHIANEDYDMLGCINFQDDSAIMLYGKNSSFRVPSGEQFYREESYTKALEWFIENAIVPEERAAYQANLFIRRIRDELARNGSYEFQLHVTGADGRRLTKKIRYARYDRASEVCLFTQTDITALLVEEERKQSVLKNALAQAEQANAAKTSFLSRMSHDMRTPMNGILGLAALSEDEWDPAVLRDNIRRIRESGDYLLSLINDTLDFQRIESGKMKLEKQIVDTQTVLDGILDIVRPGMARKKIHFDVRNDNADLNWYILLDPVRFKQIFINLLSNAMKFTPEGGNVSFIFGCSGRDGMISHDYVKVCDNGIGMSADFLQNGLFKPFSQENSAVSSEYAGSGLGLSIVHSLVELMGGKIEVESALGVGTTFTVYLDFQRVDGGEAKTLLGSSRRQLSSAGESLRGRRILLAEDHPLNAEIARRLLEKVGCRVDVAVNGQEAVEAVRRADAPDYDAILMDIRMPVMDGLSAARAIRALPGAAAQAVPIIAMTANAYEEDVKNTFEAGMNAHLAKPIVPEKLYETLARLTRR